MVKKASVKKVAKPSAKGLAGAAKPKLLAGGNPQLAKADGDGAVRAFIAAMPGWKQGIGRYLDELIVREVPCVKKAVRWNTPFYGVEGQGWFLGFHCITKYVKVALLNGASLLPPPPVQAKHQATRYLHVHEGEPLDEPMLVSWLRQAAALPGEHLF